MIFARHCFIVTTALSLLCVGCLSPSRIVSWWSNYTGLVSLHSLVVVMTTSCAEHRFQQMPIGRLLAAIGMCMAGRIASYVFISMILSVDPAAMPRHRSALWPYSVCPSVGGNKTSLTLDFLVDWSEAKRQSRMCGWHCMVLCRRTVWTKRIVSNAAAAAYSAIATRRWGMRWGNSICRLEPFCSRLFDQRVWSVSKPNRSDSPTSYWKFQFSS